MSESLPLNLFALARDPLLVREIVIKHYPNAKFDALGAAWTRAEVAEKRFLISSKPVLTVNHDASYYAEPGWSRQLEGMAGYFSRCEPNPRQQIIVSQVIPQFTFSVACLFHRQPRENDIAFLGDLCRSLKGFIFDGAQLLDADGRCVLDTDGNEDPAASFPQELYSAPEAVTITVEETAARTVAVAAVVLRAILERDLQHMDDPAALHQRLLAWTKACEVEQHLEPEEAKMIAASPGTLTQQQVIDGLWQVEGLEVLLWALGKRSIAQLHQVSDVDTPLDLAGTFDSDALATLLQAKLRTHEELAQQQAVQLTVHWRLREYRLRPGHMDFPAFVSKATFGPLSLDGVPLLKNDLAIGESALHEAPDELKSLASSMAQERHRAINWLCWGGSWVHTDTAT